MKRAGSGQPASPITLAGTPATVFCAGTGWSTTEPAFAVLFKTLLKDKLGGRWDPLASSTAVGQYWEKLYQVRNDIVHRAPHPRHL